MTAIREITGCLRLMQRADALEMGRSSADKGVVTAGVERDQQHMVL